MRAILLAAGLGTRLRPLTDQVPKCMIPIEGHPQIAYWFELLHMHGVTQTLVNTHYLSEQVEEYVKTARLPLEVTLVHEPELLGSAGTLMANRDFFEGYGDFVIGYADTLTDADLTAMRALHERMGKRITIGLFRTPTPSACGIAALDEEGVVLSFEEKPEQPKSDLGFAGVAIASPRLFDAIPDEIPCDLGSDVLAGLVGDMTGWELTGYYLRDIGTPESYEMAQEEIRNGELKVKVQ